MPMINIEDSYILDETGAQVNKVTGLFTKDEGATNGEKAQARANIGAGSTSPNLLDNPWWGLNEVINQRGNTSGQTTHDTHSIDRWKMSYGSALGNWSIAADGITITAASGTYALFGQVLANKDAIEGKTVTASVLLGDGTIVSGTIPSFTWATNPIAYEHNGLQLRFLASGTFRVNVTGGNSKTIRAVKVEVGSVSTLANDAPPDYYDELEHCKWYFERIKALSGNYAAMGFGYAASATVATIFVPMHAKRGSGYTVSTSGSFRLVYGQTTYTVTAISKYSSVSNNWLVLTVTSSGMTVGQPLEFGARADSAAYIDVSNDL